MKFKSDKQRKAVMSKMKERNGSSSASASTISQIRNNTITALNKSRDENRVSNFVVSKDNKKEFELNKNKIYLTEAGVYRHKTQLSDRYTIKETEDYNPSNKKSTTQVVINDDYYNRVVSAKTFDDDKKAQKFISNFKKTNDSREPKSTRAVYSHKNKVVGERQLSKDYSSADIVRGYNTLEQKEKLNFNKKEIKVNIYNKYWEHK